ncbi:AMP-binding protein [Facklamia hominis]|uniref:AMP-binding protein n=1 Tax=Facklamia hominis TaxID=178214 RepID=UPI0038FC5641
MNKLLKRYNEVIEERYNKIMLKTHKGEAITYGVFDEKVNCLATHLSKNFCNDAIIPVLSNDNLDYLMAMIACWKLNKVYMPLNYNTPYQRIVSTLARIGTKSILSRNYSEKLEEIKIVTFDFSEAQTTSFKYSNESETAYILSTSGTTGNPKMVQVSFENLFWLLKTMNSVVPFYEDDTFVISTPPQFDVSFHENLSFIFGEGILQFVTTGTPIQQFKKLKDMLITGKISHIALSPTSLKTILSITKEKFKNTGLKNIILAGEVLPVKLVKQLQALLPEAKILNCYGPTETTIYATYYVVKNLIGSSTIPIGEPLEGVDIKFYNSHEVNLNSGEILIGGKGVSKGYFDNVELTRDKFIMKDNQIFYRTGDLGFKEDGLIYYQGREDRQVKINGIRIELEEIEQVAQEFLENYINFSVLKIENNLVLFSDQQLDFQALTDSLSLHLPEYMIPNHYVKVTEMKLTASNKLDTEYLKNEFKKNYTRSATNSTTEESNIKDILSEILSEATLDESTNLMLLPQMDSLTQIEIVVALEDHYQVELSEDFVKKTQTITAMKKFFDNLSIRKYTNQATLTELQKVNYYSNLKNIRELNNIILKMGEPIYKDSYYLQKSYIVDNFRQVLELKVSLPETASKISIIEDIICKVIEKNELLRTILDEDNNLIVYPSYNHRVPVVSSYLIESLREKVINNLKERVFDKLLWEVYFDNDQNELYFFINHLITDQFSLSIIEKDIITILNGGNLKNGNSFSDFVNFINKNSSNDTLEKIFIQGFEQVVAKNFFSTSHNTSSKYFKVKTPYKGNYDNIVFGNFILSELLCASQNQEIVSGSTIINLREFNEQSFKTTFGDIHTTLPFIYKVSDDYCEFKERFDDIYNYFLSGDNLNHSIYKNYPIIPEEFQKYEFYLDDNLKFSNNFLGAIREKDLDRTIEELYKQQYSLENFSSAKLYITFFCCGDELIFVPITQKLLNI